MKGTARSLLLGSILISAIGFSACSDEEDENPAVGGADTGTGGKTSVGGKTSTGGKANTGGTTTGVGGKAVGGAGVGGAGVGGTTGVGGAGVGGKAVGGAGVGGAGVGGATAGATGVGGSTAGATGVGGSTAGATGVGGSTAGATGVGGATAGATGVAGNTNIAGNTGIAGSTVGVAGTTGVAGSTVGVAGSDSGVAGSGTAGAAGAGGCGTANGTLTQTTTFATASSTAPFQSNFYTAALNPAFAQTTTAPTGIDCSTGCAVFTQTFAAGTAAYKGNQIVQYFGAAGVVQNLLNETITLQIATVVTPATGATSVPPVTVRLVGMNEASSNNTWDFSMGSTATLDAATGFHTVTKLITDFGVPSWAPVATICASGIHTFGLRVQTDGTAVTADTAGTVDVYIKSIAIAP